MAENKVKTNKNDKGLSQIGRDEKRSWGSVAFIWIGTMICIPMLMVGGIFAENLTIGSIFGVTVAGFAVCCLLMVLGGMIGSDLGLNATMTSTHAFGMTGANFSMALVIFIAETGWFAVQTATCALAFNTLMETIGIAFPFWLSCTIWGIVMFITAVYGVKWMAVLNYIAVPLLVILCGYGCIQAGRTRYGCSSHHGAGRWRATGGTAWRETRCFPSRCGRTGYRFCTRRGERRWRLKRRRRR